MTTRRLVMFNQVSADGYFSDAAGSLDWVVSDPEIHARAVAGMPHTDTILFGRRTYEQFASFWPHALADLSVPGPHRSNKADPAFSAMAHWLNDTPKLVFSRSLKQATWNRSELWNELDPRRLAALKKAPGKDLLLFGSGTIVAQLTEQGLIDEYRFVVCPVLLGQGQSLLGQSDMTIGTSLKLLEAVSFKSGNVMLTYRRADAR